MTHRAESLDLSVLKTGFFMIYREYLGMVTICPSFSIRVLTQMTVSFAGRNMAAELLGHGNATTLLSVHPGPRRNGRTREVRAESSLTREVLRMGVGRGGLDRVAGGETASALALHRMRV